MTRSIPRLLAITDGRGPGTASLERWLDELVRAGVDGVQLRAKALADSALLRLAQRLREALPKNVVVLVNGRLDIALAAGCQGVHLPSNGLPARASRRAFGEDVLIGCSTHHPTEVAAARESGADYVCFGPVFPTPSKVRYGPPPGLEGLASAAAEGIPVLALGGISSQNISEALAAGASGIAAIRLFEDRGELARLRDRRETLGGRHP